VTLRWPLIGSLVALVAGAGLAALVLAFCGGSESKSSVLGSSTRTPASRTVTVTRTAHAGTPVGTGTPSKTPSTPAPAEETATPSDGEPSEETPEVAPPPEDTVTLGPEPTQAPDQTPPPGQTPAAPSPTQPAGTITPPSPTLTPLPTSTPTPPPVLPDLVPENLFVSSDVLGVRLGNHGRGTVPAGQEIEFLVRGVVAEAVTLTDALPPGTSVSIALEDQVIYRPELVLVVVDPSNLIPEEDDGNNGLAKQLIPDVALDLAVHGVFRSPDTSRPLVVIENTTSAPAEQVEVDVTVYVGSATEPTTVSTYRITIEPLGFETVEVMGVLALQGTHMRVVVTMTDPPDANLSNNAWEGDIS
jgi:hypothetical protein